MNFGIYTDRGYWTCEGRPGSAGFEEIDAKTFAEWGVDYVKTDAWRRDNDVGILLGNPEDMWVTLNFVPPYTCCHGNPQPSFLGGYNPYIWGLK